MRHTFAPVLLVTVLALAPLRAAEHSTSPETKLAALNLSLPATNSPIANYVAAVRTGNLVFLSGHLPFDAERKVIAGKVGRDTDEKTATAAARTTALALLATLKKELGDLAKVKRVVKVNGFVNAVDDFKGQSGVINGCSDLLVAVLGEKGKHARAALGVASLPLGAVVEIEMIVEVE
ncbi:MAG: RidA family protein [Chthoniobacteraceae bacterium]